MKLLFATNNPAKAKRYKDKLVNKNIDVLTLKDIDVKIDVDENGKNAIENALIKARSYYEATGIPCIGIDDNLYIEGLPEERQIGTKVRRINGKYLSDDEMIKFYTGLAKEFGGKLNAKWIYGIAFVADGIEESFTWDRGGFCFIDRASKIINTGYPLNSISYIPKFEKFISELTDEEKDQVFGGDTGAIDFVIECVNKL